MAKFIAADSWGRQFVFKERTLMYVNDVRTVGYTNTQSLSSAGPYMFNQPDYIHDNVIKGTNETEIFTRDG